MKRKVCLLVLLAAVACSGPEVPPGGALVHFEGGTVRAEVADEQAERATGLMNRREMDEDAGMLFVFETVQPVSVFFYMKNTLIPLSIAFMKSVVPGESDYEVVDIVDMDPCPDGTDPCPSYYSDEPFDAAVEVNQGWFEEQGIKAGTRASVGLVEAELRQT